MIGFYQKSLVFSSVAAIVALAACSPDNTPSNVPKGPYTEMQLVNADPTLASADVYESGSRTTLGSKVASAIAYGASDTVYTTYNNHFFSFTTSGQTTVVSNGGSSTFLPLEGYEIVAIDSMGTHIVQELPMIWNDTAAADAQVRFVNAAEGVGTIDTYVLDTTQATLASCTSLAFPDNTGTCNSSNNYLSFALPANHKVILDVMPTGVTPAADNSNALFADTVTMTAQTGLDVFAMEASATDTTHVMGVVLNGTYNKPAGAP